VTVEPPNTEKLAAVPKPTVAGAAQALLAKSSPHSNPSITSPDRDVLRQGRMNPRVTCCEGVADRRPVCLWDAAGHGRLLTAASSTAIEGDGSPGPFDPLPHRHLVARAFVKAAQLNLC
jgi:hypothetical protein